MKFTIEPLQHGDWEAVRTIFAQGLATGDASFETGVPDWETWHKNHREDCRLVGREGDIVVGWAALSPVTDRCAYRGVAEVSIYVREDARGRGVGKALLKALIHESERAGIWTLQAGIFPENKASLALHKACGFREVGVRERLGRLNGVWRDVVFIERRSSKTGLS